MKLLHAADLHLDSPFHSLPAAESRARREGQRQTLDALRDIALTHAVDAVLLPGDLFDGQQTHPETLTYLAKTLGEMNCPVFLAPGNHDPFTPHSPYHRVKWPGNVHIFSAEAVECVPIPGRNVEVYGAGFVSPQRESDPLAGFTAAENGQVRLGCFHGQVGPADNPYGPIAPASLAHSGLHYVALGHVHAFSGLEAAGSTRWAYSGCAQGRGFDEAGDKGCLLVEVTREDVSATFLPLPGPRYQHLSVDISALDNPLPALGQALLGHENDYCRLRLTGQCPMPDLPALSQSLSGQCRALQLLDATTPPLDLWAGAGEENLKGLFLREMRQRLDAAEGEEKETLLLALRCGLAALENREFPSFNAEVGQC